MANTKRTLFLFAFKRQRAKEAGVKNVKIPFGGNEFQTWCHAAVIFFFPTEKHSVTINERERGQTQMQILFCGLSASVLVFHLGLFLISLYMENKSDISNKAHQWTAAVWQEGLNLSKWFVYNWMVDSNHCKLHEQKQRVRWVNTKTTIKCSTQCDARVLTELLMVLQLLSKSKWQMPDHRKMIARNTSWYVFKAAKLDDKETAQLKDYYAFKSSPSWEKILLFCLNHPSQQTAIGWLLSPITVYSS